MSVVVVGAIPLSLKLKALVESLNDSETRQVFRASANIIRDEAKRRAPVGKNLSYSVLGSRREFVRNKGTVRKAIIAWASKRGKNPAAYARTNVLNGPNAASHAHLVEFGTAARTAKKGKFLVFANKAGTGLVFAKRVAAMAARPFFRPAVEAAGPRALEAAASKTSKVLQRFIDTH